MRWTTRLKRAGGYKRLLEERIRQFAKLGNMFKHPSRYDKEELEMARAAVVFLEGNELRRLSYETCVYFGWETREA